MKSLPRDGQLMAFEHHGFWQPMDTLRDRHHLEELWESGKAPWKIWKETDPIEIGAAKKRKRRAS